MRTLLGKGLKGLPPLLFLGDNPVNVNPDTKIAEYNDKHSICKIQEKTTKTFYNNNGQVPEGQEERAESQEVHDTRWRVIKPVGDEKFEDEEELEKFLRTTTKLKDHLVKASGGTEYYGFEADKTTNSADSVVFRHDTYSLVIQAGLNQDRSYGYEQVGEDTKHRITIQAVVNEKGLVLKQTSYNYDEIPTVEEFYGCVKMFIEEYLVRGEHR